MNQPRLKSLLMRTGEWYILITIAVSQIIGLIGAIPGIISIQLTVGVNAKNGGFTNGWMFGLSSLIVLVICWLITSNARGQIALLNFDARKSEKNKELAAWKEITNIPTQYGVVAFFVYMTVNVMFPFLSAILQNREATTSLQQNMANSPAPAYFFFGGFAAVLGLIITSSLFVGWLMIPARNLLLPTEFEEQAKGRTGALLVVRFEITILSLLFIALATITSISHQKITQVLSGAITPSQALYSLQPQVLFLSIVVLALGAGITFFSIQSVAGPAKNLTGVLQKLEQGDFSQRVPVLTTDEMATVAIHFNHMLAQFEELQSSLEKQVRERTRQLAATNEVGRVAASILDPDELFRKITNLIIEQFNYYYAAIYLLDPSEKWANLKEATGQAGDVLKQNRHRLEMAGRSIVAICMREKIPQIVQNTSEETQRVDNPLLPYTRSEIALPLIVGDRVIGALDVQSTKPSDFDTNIIETMQNMAAQIAIALENARLFQESQQGINELRAIQKQYLFEGWNNIKSYNENLEYGVGDASDAEEQKIENPIILRDQIFGKITLEGQEEWTAEQRSLVDAITTQAAIALENARLVSESRQIALRERTLTEINSKIWSSPTIDSILQNVVKELGRRLDTSNTIIELNLDDES